MQEIWGVGSGFALSSVVIDSVQCGVLCTSLVLSCRAKSGAGRAFLAFIKQSILYNQCGECEFLIRDHNDSRPPSSCSWEITHFRHWLHKVLLHNWCMALDMVWINIWLKYNFLWNLHLNITLFFVQEFQNLAIHFFTVRIFKIKISPRKPDRYRKCICNFKKPPKQSCSTKQIYKKFNLACTVFNLVSEWVRSKITVLKLVSNRVCSKITVFNLVLNRSWFKITVEKLNFNINIFCAFVREWI